MTPERLFENLNDRIRRIAREELSAIMRARRAHQLRERK